MKPLKNKVYREDDGRSFDHLMDKNGQFRLKDVAEFLEKSASAFASTINKLADSNQLQTYNSSKFLLDDRPRDTAYWANKNSRDLATGVNRTAVNGADRTSAEFVQRAAPMYQQTVTNDENKTTGANTVYPDSSIQENVS